MDTLDETLDTILERALATGETMETLGKPPHNFNWAGESSGAFHGRIDLINEQVKTLALAEAGTTLAATRWDDELGALIDLSQLGTNNGRFKFKAASTRSLFESLRYRGTGRDARYKQVLDFEVAWQTADPNWVFKPGLTLSDFSARREAVVTVLEKAHVVAETNEKHQRATLHDWADELHQVCVDWYRIATSTFAENTIAGQLIRTIPTTYNPDRPPGELTFTAHMSTAPNSAHLLWRAPRGKRYFIFALMPGKTEFELILDGVEDTEWVGLGLTAGLWQFKGYAVNADGTGVESEVIQMTIANAQAA